MRTTHLLSIVSLAVASLAPATGHGADADGEIVEQEERTRGERRYFLGQSFHTHFDIGAAYGQQVVEVATIGASADAGKMDSERAVAGGLGIASRLSLWPVYGRYGGVGGYAEGQVGVMRRDNGATAVFSGSAGVVASLGFPRLKGMVAIGRSRHAGAYGEANGVVVSELSVDSGITAGVVDIRAHRLGLGVRAPLDGGERRGVDLWVFFDDQVDSGAPAIGLPNLADSALSMRGSFWMRNTLIVSAEVVMRGAAVDPTVGGTRLADRTAMVMLGWSMDRFSRPYGG
jgi:hypothetical protein